MTEVSNLAKNVFDAQQVVQSPVPEHDHHSRPAINAGRLQRHHEELIDGRSQVLLDVRLIQVAHTSERNTGVQLPPEHSRRSTSTPRSSRS